MDDQAALCKHHVIILRATRSFLVKTGPMSARTRTCAWIGDGFDDDITTSSPDDSSSKLTDLVNKSNDDYQDLLLNLSNREESTLQDEALEHDEQLNQAKNLGSKSDISKYDHASMQKVRKLWAYWKQQGALEDRFYVAADQIQTPLVSPGVDTGEISHFDAEIHESRTQIMPESSNEHEIVLSQENLDSALRWASFNLKMREIFLLIQARANLNSHPIGEKSPFYLAFDHEESRRHQKPKRDKDYMNKVSKKNSKIRVEPQGDRIAQHRQNKGDRTNVLKYLLGSNARIDTIEENLGISFVQLEMLRTKWPTGVCDIDLLKSLVTAEASTLGSVVNAKKLNQDEAAEYLSMVSNTTKMEGIATLSIWNQLRMAHFQYSSDLNPGSCQMSRQSTQQNLSNKISSCRREDEIKILQKEIDECQEMSGDQAFKEILNQTNDTGHTLLHIACYFGRNDIVQVLLRYNADINSRDCTGRTPVYYAISQGHLKVVNLIVPDYWSIVSALAADNEEKGAMITQERADLDNLDMDLITPLDLAIKHGHSEIVTYLKKAGASEGTTVTIEADHFNVWYYQGCASFFNQGFASTGDELENFPMHRSLPFLNRSLLYSLFVTVVQLFFCIAIFVVCSRNESLLRSVSFSRWVDDPNCQAIQNTVLMGSYWNSTISEWFSFEKSMLHSLIADCQVAKYWQIDFILLCASRCNLTCVSSANCSCNADSPFPDFCEADLYITNKTYVSPFDDFFPLQGLVCNMYSQDQPTLGFVQLVCLSIAIFRVVRKVSEFQQFINMMQVFHWKCFVGLKVRWRLRLIFWNGIVIFFASVHFLVIAAAVLLVHVVLVVGSKDSFDCILNSLAVLFIVDLDKKLRFYGKQSEKIVIMSHSDLLDPQKPFFVNKRNIRFQVPLISFEVLFSGLYWLIWIGLFTYAGVNESLFQGSTLLSLLNPMSQLGTKQGYFTYYYDDRRNFLNVLYSGVLVAYPSAILSGINMTNLKKMRSKFPDRYIWEIELWQNLLLIQVLLYIVLLPILVGMVF